MQNRHTRYQGAIIQDHHILLIKHRENKAGRSYWLLPGGGIEPNETEEACVRREMKEETNLDVEVVKLLVSGPGHGPYQSFNTYLCHPATGDAAPGSEPEAEHSAQYSIAEVKWFDLRNESGWDAALIADPFTYDELKLLRKTLGYLTGTR